MFKRMPLLVTLLVAAMLVGLVGHGVELFYPVEGGNFYGFIKALGFPLAFECGNAVGLYVGFNHRTKGGWTRFVALLIGLACLITSYIVQHHYFHQRIEWDWWYAGVLPGLVALLSALVGLLDHDHAKAATDSEDVHTKSRFQSGVQPQPTELWQSPSQPQISSTEIQELHVRFTELQDSLREIAAAVRIIQEPAAAQAAAASETAEVSPPSWTPQSHPLQEPQSTGWPQAETATVPAAKVREVHEEPQPLPLKLKDLRPVTVGAEAADGGVDTVGSEPQAHRVSLRALLGEELLAGTEFSSSAIVSTAAQAALPQIAQEPIKMSAPEIDFSRISALKRDEWCYQLRMSGWNYPEIGKLIGKSQDSASRYARAHAKRNGLSFR